MIKRQTKNPSPWVISWQAALTPELTMIPAEDIFLLDSPIRAASSQASLTATIANMQGLLLHTPDPFLYSLSGIQPESTQKSARTTITKSCKKPQRVSAHKSIRV